MPEHGWNKHGQQPLNFKHRMRHANLSFKDTLMSGPLSPETLAKLLSHAASSPVLFSLRHFVPLLFDIWPLKVIIMYVVAAAA